MSDTSLDRQEALTTDATTGRIGTAARLPRLPRLPRPRPV